MKWGEAWSAPLAIGLLGGFLASLVTLIYVKKLSLAPVWRHLGIICLTVIGLIGAISGEVSFLQAIVAVSFASAALVAATMATDRIAAGDAIEMQSHWGGLGGALGGWRLSPATSLLLVALFFAGGALGVVATSKHGPGDMKNMPAAATDAANKDKAETGGKDKK